MRTNNRMYLMSVCAVLAVALVGFLQWADFSGVSAQKIRIGGTNRATPEMIAYALTHETEDLATRYNIMNQLPCENLDGGLSGKSLGAGVYCASSAKLAGELTFDAAGDQAAVFIVRVAGAFDAEANSRISLLNGAQAANIHFVADSATIGAGSEFKGSILANNRVNIGSGATLKGRIQSVNNAEQARDFDAPEGGGTGTLEICKSLDASAGNDISNRIFEFTVTGAVTVGTTANPVRVPVGSCSAPFEVTAGQQTITESNTGTTVQGGTFSGGFVLNRVETITSNSPSTLLTVNRATRQATVNIVDSGIGQTQELAVRFVNQFAITGFVEICKRAALVPTADGTGFTTTPDPDVTGFFTYTIDGVFTTAANGAQTLQQFVVPVGQCTNAIAVTITNPAPFGQPRESQVRITELARDPGVFLESVDTIPTDRLLNFVPNRCASQTAPNTDPTATTSCPGGGYATVRVIEGATPANETLINFRNRSIGVIKVCKIAGPGLALNTPFTFTVTGLAQTGLATVGAGGVVTPATFATVTRNLTVTAGPAAQGGNCVFVPNTDGTNQRFVVGTRVTIDETGPLTAPNNIFNPPITGQVRTSRITTSGPTTQLTTDLTPTATRVSRAVVTARSEVVAVSFVNFIYNPADLKICKIAGSTAINNQSFNFTVTLQSPTDGNGVALFPAQVATATVTAGPAANGGNCVVVDGSGLIGGAFAAGLTYNVVETAVTGTSVTAASSSTSTGVQCNLTTRTCTFTGGGTAALLPRTAATINIVTYTNSTTAVPGTAARPFDFDGDGKADLSTFSTNGVWRIMGSNSGLTGIQFGQVGDKLVPTDYDGDGKTDVAVYRGGVWYIQQSQAGFKALQFGEANDVPQPADFDGDGRADMAVYRPSNGIWYWLGSTSGFSGIQFGSINDKAVVGDYDGDGRADQAVFRPENGMWYINGSRSGFTAVQFGSANDRVVPADYDGDGRTDVAVYRDGTWYINGSTSGYKSLVFGTATDRPIQADYDGNGKADIAIYRDGMWYIMDNAEGQLRSVQFGATGDAPVPASYLK